MKVVPSSHRGKSRLALVSLTAVLPLPHCKLGPGPQQPHACRRVWAPAVTKVQTQCSGCLTGENGDSAAICFLGKN